jgi:predicted transcriptional regulator
MRNDLEYANSQPNEDEIKNKVNEKLVQWYDRFGDYIQKVDFHLYNEACEYADGENS